MRVLITGSNGLLAQKLLQYAADRVDVVASDVTKDAAWLCRHATYRKLDVTERGEVLRVVQELTPQWVVNTAAITNVDLCEEERELCWLVNVEGARNLSEAVRLTGGNLLHLSSDYVFDGTTGPYSEEDVPNPIGYYGESKLASENVIRASGVQYLIVRTNVLYGVGERTRRNFVDWVLDKLRQGRPFQVATDQYGNPTLADDLAKAIWKLIVRDARGLYHIGGADFLDRYTFAKAIAEVFGYDAGLIGETTTVALRQKAPRPSRSGLLWDRCREQHGVEMRGVVAGLEVVREQMAARQRP